MDSRELVVSDMKALITTCDETVADFQFLGADFKKQFDMESYRSFFQEMGYDNVEYHVVNGRMPCAIAVINMDI